MPKLPPAPAIGHTAASDEDYAIAQLLVRYANAVDARAWDKLDSIFTPDAWLDYRGTGGKAGRYAAVKPWLPQALRHFSSYQHLMSNIESQIDGDTASTRSACLNPMTLNLPLLPKRSFMLSFWYVDTLVRTPEGWRISRREQIPSTSLQRPLVLRVAQWWLKRKPAAHVLGMENRPS